MKDHLDYVIYFWLKVKHYLKEPEVCCQCLLIEVKDNPVMDISGDL